MKTIVKTVSAVGFFSLLSIAPVATSSGKSSENLLSFTILSTSKTTASTKVVALYDAMKLKNFGLTKAAFEYALKGYEYLIEKHRLNRSSVLSICDFSQSSRRKRFFVIDMEKNKVLINTYVAHGRKSGSEYARSFSNNPDSHMSSLGFYKTETTYYGDHGLALKIEGLEKGFNDKADARNIVLHGSKYVGADFLRYNRFNGRSFGCPAIPASQINSVINTIKNGSCLFIYHPTKKYLTQSKILND